MKIPANRLVCGENFLFVERTVGCAGSVISALKILGTERAPSCGTEDLLFGDIVKSNGNSEY